MKRSTLSFLSAALLALAAPACTDTATDGSSQSELSGRAELSIVVTGDASASLDLTATATATGEVALSQHLDLAADGSVAATIELPEGDYSFSLSALADDGVTVTAHGDVAVAIAAQATISLSATLDAAAGGGLETEVNLPPAIGDVGISVISDLRAGLDALGDATLTASVSDAEGNAITYFWSGLTIDGSIEGSANGALTIDNDAMVRAQLDGHLDASLGAQFFVVAQDEAGGAALAEVTIGGNGTCLLCGSSSVAVVAGAGVGVVEDVSERVEACLDAHVACAASCDALVVHEGGNTSAGASCNLACGADLAACANGS
jgi:hypothetical protein